jgi:hypothetical protein
MRQFMELQAVFAMVILSGELPSGLLSDPVGTEEDPAAGHDAQGRQLFPPAVLEQLRGFLFYHLTMGIALQHDLRAATWRCSMTAHLAADGENVAGSGGRRQCDVRGADGGRRLSALVGGAVVHAVVRASAVGERDAELDPGAARAGHDEPPAS